MNTRSLAVTCLLAVGCAREASAPPAPLPAVSLSDEFPVGRVAAVVNGKPISEAEVVVRLRDRGGFANRDEALDALIVLELQAQQAEAAGLHKSPDFQTEMEVAAAKFRDARRVKLSKTWRLKTLATLEAPKEDELKTWFASNAAFIQTEWRLKRLTTRVAGDADKALAALNAGKPFDEVVASFPGEPVDLGPLRFDAISEAWWQALKPLQPGQHTGVIPQGERFIILEVVERTALPPADFSSVRPRILSILQAQQYEQRMRGLGDELKKGAVIEKKPYVPANTPGSEPLED